MTRGTGSASSTTPRTDPEHDGPRYVWTQDGKLYDDTIHLAGCTHTHLRPETVNPLAATTVEQARAEIAEAMGWTSYPELDGNEFDIMVARCARRTEN